MQAVTHLSRLRCLIALICTCIFVPAIHAQSTEADLTSRLKDKSLYLRGFWRDDTLHFDSTGHLFGTSDPVTFTLSGFDLKSAQLKQNKLILEGQRVGLELANNKQERVPLMVGRPRHGRPESMHIEIDASQNGDYGPALDAIFIEGIADLVPSLPFYWKSYAQKNFLPAAAADTPPATSVSAKEAAPSEEPQPRRIGGGIAPPKLLHTAEPKFTDSAKTLLYGGNCLVNLHVEPNGTVSHVSVVRAVGLGLDESALAAVQQYIFSPSMMNGVPILVELNIEVNFQIF
jgi:TonB family protein